MTLQTPLIDINRLGKTYCGSAGPVKVFENLNLHVNHGEFVAIMGPSGAGKSTLLQLLGCLDTPSSGSYRLAGREVGCLSEPELARTRSQCIGFVFQSSHFIDYMSLLDNVALAGAYTGRRKGRRDLARAARLLRQVGLEHRSEHRPAELSGGERQRAALARAVFNEPTLLLADEPTGNLDKHNALRMHALLAELNAAGTTILMVTHDVAMAKLAKRRLDLRAGSLEQPC